MDKYYAPEIEEFHVGFEYEWFKPTYNKWSKEKFENTRELYFIERSLRKDFENKFVRVKYLDREDIESCGFEFRYINTANDDQYFSMNNNRNWVHVSLTRFSSWVVLKIESSVFKDSIRTIVINSISIKNKSEFIIILDQLNLSKSGKSPFPA